MRDWLGKPLLIVAVIILVLGAMSALWMSSVPSAASAGGMSADQSGPQAHHRKVDQLIDEINNDRAAR